MSVPIIKNLIGNDTSPNKLIFGIPIFILAIIYIFTPFKSNQYTYEWNPKVDGNNARLTLLELNPKEFDINLPCVAISQEKEWIFEALGGPAFLFEADAKYFYFTTGNSQSSSLIINKMPRSNLNEDCSTVLNFQDNLNKIKITNGNITKSFELIQDTEFYFSSYVKWNSNLVSDDFLLRVKTKTLIGSEKTLFKTLNLFLILSLVLFHFRSSLIRFLRDIPKFKFHIGGYDLSAFLVIGFSIFTVAPMADDGLYLIQARILENFHQSLPI